MEDCVVGWRETERGHGARREREEGRKEAGGRGTE